MTAPLHAITDAILRPLVDGREVPVLSDDELLQVCERAQHCAGEQALAHELLAVAQKLHAAGAVAARDQVVIVAAVVLEDVELNGALCRRMYAGKRAVRDVV